MCRSIRSLHNYDPPTTDEEIRAAALQYVRKISGMARPAHANEDAFAHAVDAVADASARLLRELVVTAPPRDRAAEIERARARAAIRFAPHDSSTFIEASPVAEHVAGARASLDRP